MEDFSRGYINEDRILLKYPAMNRNDAIRAAGLLLLHDNLIEERYIDAMIQTCDMFDSYIVLVPGIAVPHAASEKGARANGFSIVQLEKPIEFGHAENDPVQLVLAVSAKDADSHLDMLQIIAKFISNQQIIQELIEAKQKMEVLEILKKG